MNTKLEVETTEESFNGHAAGCICAKCLDASLNAQARKFGFNPSVLFAGLGADVDMSERTRYATPGTRSGRGYVRKVSDAQVALIKRLMTERDTTNLVRLPGSEDITKMSLTGARDLIERLFACPMKPNTPAVRPATDPMKNFLKTLLSDRNHGLTVDVENISFADARKAIDFLKTQPYATRKAAAAPVVAKRAASGPITEDGMYLKDGVIYKVQIAVNGSGRLYAKKFNTETKEFEYAGTAPLRTLTPGNKMSREEAGEYGKLYGMCMRCSRTLTDEYSIANGYGKVCAGKL